MHPQRYTQKRLIQKLAANDFPPEFIFSFELSRLYFLSFSTWIHIIGLGFDIPNLSWFLHLHINKISFSTMESRGRHFCCVIQVFCLKRLKLIIEDCFFFFHLTAQPSRDFELTPQKVTCPRKLNLYACIRISEGSS